MCLNPLRIKNKGLSHNPGLECLQVPCGSCSECVEVKSIDYFVRAFAIYRSLPDDWSCFFVTFTHRPEDVPHSDFYAWNGDYYKKYDNCVCFNHELIHKAMKSFVQYYRRKFPNDFYYKSYESGFRRKVYTKVPKYLITSEFGEDPNCQHLPHYHGVIFIPERMDYVAFKALIERFWTYGFTKDIRIHKTYAIQGDRTPENCLKYVTKYASKAAGYMPDWLKEKNLLVPSLGDWYQVEPRIFTSNDFGSELEKILTEAHYNSNRLTLSVGGKYVSYCVPSYYLRRHFTKSVVDHIEKIVTDPVSYPFRVVSSKTLYRKVQHTEYINNYLEIKKNVLFTQLNKRFYDTKNVFLQMDSDFQDYLCRSVPCGYSALRDSVLSLSPAEFTHLFIKYNWNDAPVYTYDYDHVSVPTFDCVRPESRLSFSLVQLCEAGLMDKDSVHYDSFYRVI